MPNIYEYIDFRKFLSDYYDAKHELDRKFTKAAFCRKIGLPNTRGYLNEVLKGRPVSPNFVDRIVETLHFDKEETQFFRILVLFGQATKEDERELHLEQLISLNRSPKKILDFNMFALYKEWHNSVIRALLDIDNFDDDFGALAKRLLPPITARKAKESIKLLSSLGLIRKDANGYWKPAEKAISTPSYVEDELVKQYQLSLLEFAKITVLSAQSQPHNFTTNTISISNEGFGRIQKRLEKFRSEVRSLIVKDEKPAQKVYQLNIQLFPATK